MDTAKRSYRDIINFVNMATVWQQQPANKTGLSGFSYAISRAIKFATKVVEDFNEKQLEINIDTAAKDEKGYILNDSHGQTIFSATGSKERNSRNRELLDTEVEVGVFYAQMIPDDLTQFYIQAFEGFVIRERSAPAVTGCVST